MVRVTRRAADLTDLLDLLDELGDETVSTSVRLPVRLRQAAAVAASLGFGSSTSDLTVQGLTDLLRSFAQRAVLDEHYRTHPSSRPDLADVALALAELTANPLAGHPDVIRRAAADVRAMKADADADDVLWYAAGLSAAA